MCHEKPTFYFFRAIVTYLKELKHHKKGCCEHLKNLAFLFFNLAKTIPSSAMA